MLFMELILEEVVKTKTPDFVGTERIASMSSQVTATWGFT